MSQISYQNDVNDILHGRVIFSNLPPVQPRTVRIYLCAPFSDTIGEQNELFENIFPKLREFTMYRYGFEFQVINMHWGVSEKEINNKVLINHCLEELKLCQKHSIGPMFLALIGENCGTQLLPLSIERTNFDKIIEALNEAKIDCKLLQSFYVLNRNLLTNHYDLKTDKIDGDTEKALLEVLKVGYNLAIKKSTFKEDSLTTLNDTLLEILLNNGAFNTENSLDRIFAFVRIKPEQQSNEIIEKLREKDINKLVPAEQIYRIRINETNNTSFDYKKHLGETYLKLFKKLIDKYVQQNPEYAYTAPYEDALLNFHYAFKNTIKDVLIGGEKAMKQMRDYIYDKTYRQPLILVGNMGSGKTTCLATFASTLHLQFIANEKQQDKRDVIVLRFIGADRKSLDLRNLLKSICLQLNTIYLNENDENIDKSMLSEKVPTKFCELKQYFKMFLTKNLYKNADPECEPKLIILLDSLQDIGENNYSYKLDWLPLFLKANCKLILTVSSENERLVEKIQNKYTNERSYAYLDYLSLDQADSIVKKYLNTHKYHLEEQQYEVIRKAYSNTRILSLNLKLLSHEFLNWKSYTPIDECIAKNTLVEAILHYFSSLEKKYGEIIVKYILSYITISEKGLSELELQDLLSLDNTLLKQIILNLNQSNETLRVPWFYILPIIHDLQKHLILRPDHGIQAIYWRHKLFAQIVYKKYIDSNPEFKKHLHVSISEYYMGVWAEPKQKPLEYEETVMPKMTNEFTFGTPYTKKYTINKNRLVPKQPIQYETFHTHIKARFNLRKLMMLPYHLIKAGMAKELFDEVFFNIEWIYAKICAIDLQSLLYDFDMYKESSEVNLVNDSLKMAESALMEDPNLLFVELTGRLIPYYNLYENIRRLIDQCDSQSIKTNPIVPIGQIYKAPSWILQETFDIGIHLKENLQIDLLESEYHGRLLIAKNSSSVMAKFFDLNLMEMKGELFTDPGLIYCSRNGKYACNIGKNSTFIIKRIENGELHGEVPLNAVEIGHIYISDKYASITIRKTPSPVIIDLEKAKVHKILPYQSSFTCISPDDQAIVIHSEDKLNYHKLPSLQRLISLQSREIPEVVLFAKKNSKVYTLSRSTKQVTFYNIFLEKRHCQVVPILQDVDIFDLKLSPNEQMLLICSLNCLYVIDTNTNDCNLLYILKPNMEPPSNDPYDEEFERLKSSSSFSTISTPSTGQIYTNYKKKSITDNVLNGFGCTANNQIIYATYYTYLFCWDAATGLLLRIFQSTVSASRIIRSYSSNICDCIISLLDDGTILSWNLKNVDKNISFEDMTLYSNPVIDCTVPKIEFDSAENSSSVVSYCHASPDAKVHDLKTSFSVKSMLSTYYDEKIDNPLKSKIDLICTDQTGRFCFIVIDMEEFLGKRIPEEAGFMKKVASLIDLHNDSIVMEKFSYIVRQKSRFEITAKFLNKSNTDIYLLIQTTSCLNDFDPYNEAEFDWSEFETVVKLFGPIKYKRDDNESQRLPLFDEFKLFGEPLSDICITKDFVYAILMQECHKLIDQENPSVVKARRYEIHLNIYELFESRKDNIPVQLFDLNEFLTTEEYSHKNILIDVKTVYDGTLLVIYSKDGPTAKVESTTGQSSNKYDYDYNTFKFVRDFKAAKGAVIYDPIKNETNKRFPSIFQDESYVTQLKISDDILMIDNLWNIYDLRFGNLVYKIAKNELYDYKWTQFILNGRYLITPTRDLKKIYVIRCYDSKVVASLWIYDKVSCLKIGEKDRTILVGTSHGYLLSLKFLIDLEVHEATKKYTKFFRYIKTKPTSASIPNIIKPVSTPPSPKPPLQLPKQPISNNLTTTNQSAFTLKSNSSLNNDLRRILYSAHEHRRLKSRESSAVPRSVSVLSMNIPKQGNNDSSYESNAKYNLTNVTAGVKYANMNNSSSRACCIQ